VFAVGHLIRSQVYLWVGRVYIKWHWKSFFFVCRLCRYREFFSAHSAPCALFFSLTSPPPLLYIFVGPLCIQKCCASLNPCVSSRVAHRSSWIFALFNDLRKICTYLFRFHIHIKYLSLPISKFIQKVYYIFFHKCAFPNIATKYGKAKYSFVIWLTQIFC